MSTTALLPFWDGPSPWNRKDRELASIDQQAAIDGARSLARAEAQEFEAQIRRRYMGNRVLDASEVIGLVFTLSKGDARVQAGLMELASIYLQTEGEIYRNNFR